MTLTYYLVLSGSPHSLFYPLKYLSFQLNAFKYRSNFAHFTARGSVSVLCGGVKMPFQPHQRHGFLSLSEAHSNSEILNLYLLHHTVVIGHLHYAAFFLFAELLGIKICLFVPALKLRTYPLLQTGILPSKPYPRDNRYNNAWDNLFNIIKIRRLHLCKRFQFALFDVYNPDWNYPISHSLD